MNLSIENLSLAYSGQAVLRNLELEVRDAQVVAVVGPSGGGKSTLLRILAGLQRPDTGEVRWDGRSMSFEERPLLAHRRSVGTVFQAFNLFPHLTALDNIVLPLVKAHGVGRDEAMRRAQSYLARFQVETHAHKKPGLLSGGQRQRVAIARAMAFEPSLLFFDEPTSALDPEMTYEVLEAIREVRTEGRDLFLVTHEIGFAREVADTLVFLSHGRVLESGPARDRIDHPESEAARTFFSRVLRW